MVEGYREAGVMRADVPADHVARTMTAAAHGFFAQMALFGDAEPKVLESGLRGLVVHASAGEQLTRRKNFGSNVHHLARIRRPAVQRPR